MIDFIDAVDRESSTFLRRLRELDMSRVVPSCPEWTVADLTWHLTQVQHFWAAIVSGLLEDPSRVDELTRPTDDQLSGLMASTSAALVEVLREKDPAEPCWSWYTGGGHVAWVMRRQAHEALIHRIDLELAAGSVSPVDDDLAADGIDEILQTMIDASDIPEWARFEPDGFTGCVVAEDRSPDWTFEFGRFLGRHPDSATEYDEPAILLGEVAGEPSVRIAGGAADLDRWLWGRGSLEAVNVTGDRRLALVLRDAAASSTQ